MHYDLIISVGAAESWRIPETPPDIVGHQSRTLCHVVEQKRLPRRGHPNLFTLAASVRVCGGSLSPSLPPPPPPFSFFSEWSGTCIALITSVQLVSWQLIPTWEQQRERPRASQMMSAMCIKLLERQDKGCRCPPRGNRCWVLSRLHSPGVGYGPCWFRAPLRQLNAPVSVPLQCSWTSYNFLVCCKLFTLQQVLLVVFVENKKERLSVLFRSLFENSWVPLWKALRSPGSGCHEGPYEYFRGKLAKTLRSTRL